MFMDGEADKPEPNKDSAAFDNLLHDESHSDDLREPLRLKYA